MDPSTKPGSYDAAIVGSGPNGLAAAIELARQGQSVIVLESHETVGGGTRTTERTLPGFMHDVCSAIHPLAQASPFFRSLPLQDYGLEWIHPDIPLAHPLDDGSVILMHRDILETAKGLEQDDGAYIRLLKPFLGEWEKLIDGILAPLRIPRYPLPLARFGLLAIRSAAGIIASRFQGVRARAFFAGMAGHSMMALETPMSAAFGLTMAVLGHAVGWPIAKGGSQAISNAMADYFQSLNGKIITNLHVSSLDQIPPATAILFNLTPRQIIDIAGASLPDGYRRTINRFKYGPGIFKIDWALDGAIPWTAQECALAGTVHLGGTFEEIAAAERAVWHGRHPDRPFIILAQQSLFDPGRAPSGKHTAWGYCHVPNGSELDMTERIESQIERFAPGFKDRILARASYNSRQIEEYNPNYVGGDINGGLQILRQQFTRPAPRLVPYKIPGDGLYICSSSTPPGGGVHGMCGYFAAKAAMKELGK